MKNSLFMAHTATEMSEMMASRYAFGKIDYANPKRIILEIPGEYVLDKELHAKVESILDLL